MKEHIQIGEFSKLCRLSIRTLRHYDKIDLLKPVLVDNQSGYRYYHIKQLKDASLIRLLRTVDVPLDTINELIKAKEPEKFEGILKDHIRELKSRLNTYTQMVATVENLIQKKELFMELKVEMKNLTEQRTIVIQDTATMTNIGDVIGKAYGELFKHIQVSGLKCIGAPFVTYLDDDCDAQETMTMEIGIPVAGDIKIDGRIQQGWIQNLKVVSTTHKGPYTELHNIWNHFAEWTKLNDYKIDGYGMEFYHNDPAEVKPEELITELLFPVK